MDCFLLLLMIIPYSLTLPIKDYSLEQEDGLQLPASPSNLTMCVEHNLCNHGKCILLGSNISCRCDKPYVDHAGQACAERGKSKLVAFLLSFFAGGLGADWFYMSSGDTSYIFIGCIKLFIIGLFPFWCCCCWMLGMLSPSLCSNDTVKSGCVGFLLFCVAPGIILLCLSGGIWWVVDWARIAGDGWGRDGRGFWIYRDM